LPPLKTGFAHLPSRWPFSSQPRAVDA